MAIKPLAVLALSTAAVLAPVAPALASAISFPIHLHPRVHRVDDRVDLSLYNPSFNFREVKIDGHTYLVRAHRSIILKAPIGTAIYADSRTQTHRRGDVMLVVTPNLNKQQITLN